jgi:hypothetical protein
VRPVDSEGLYGHRRRFVENHGCAGIQRSGLIGIGMKILARQGSDSNGLGLKHYAWRGGAAAFVGAILAFALNKDDPVALGIRLEPLGLILLATGAVVLVWGAGQAYLAREPRPTRRGGQRAATTTTGDVIQSIGGLLAIAIGVGAVLTIAIVTLSVTSGLDAANKVAVATSAFGVVSTVVGAYVGIKITGDKTNQAAGQAQKDAQIASAQLGAAVTHLDDEAKKEVIAAGQAAAEAVPKSSRSA